MTRCEHCGKRGDEVQADIRSRIPGDPNAVAVCDDCHEDWLDGRTPAEAIAEETGETP